MTLGGCYKLQTIRQRTSAPLVFYIVFIAGIENLIAQNTAAPNETVFIWGGGNAPDMPGIRTAPYHQLVSVKEGKVESQNMESKILSSKNAPPEGSYASKNNIFAKNTIYRLINEL
jgi:hypothetical protein